jgi:hypothetical protein
MTRDDAQDSSEFRYDIASVIHNLDRGNIESRLAHFLLKSCPVRQLASRGSVAKVATFVRRIDRWQPHEASIFRAAISTASGFSPPTARLSVIDPSTSTPGTAERITAARSAVGT